MRVWLETSRRSQWPPDTSPLRVIYFKRIPVLAFAIAVLTGGLSRGAGPEWVPGDDKNGGLLETSDGVVTLEWKPALPEVELRHRKPNGREWIQKITGDTKSVVSGLDEGYHEFQLRVPDGNWGEVLAVDCAYMERGKVVKLLTSGGVVVAGIIGAIVFGSMRSKEG